MTIGKSEVNLRRAEEIKLLDEKSQPFYFWQTCSRREKLKCKNYT